MTNLITNENAQQFRAIAASAALTAQNNTGQRNDSDVDDQASYALIKIIEKFDRLGDDQISNPEGLAWSVAYYSVRSEISLRTMWGRGRKRRRELVSLDEEESLESALWRRVSKAYFYDFSPYDEVDSRVSIPPLLKVLDPQELYVITRFFFHRDSRDEIADALGYTPTNITHIKNRALLKMRRVFEKDGTL